MIMLIVGKGNQNLRPKYKNAFVLGKLLKIVQGKKCTTYHSKLEIFFLFIFNIVEINNEPLANETLKIRRLYKCSKDLL